MKMTKQSLATLNKYIETALKIKINGKLLSGCSVVFFNVQRLPLGTDDLFYFVFTHVLLASHTLEIRKSKLKKENDKSRNQNEEKTSTCKCASVCESYSCTKQPKSINKKE